MTTKKLREATGMPVAMCAAAWKESGEDWSKAIEILKEKGATRSQALSDRNADASYVGVYEHHDGKQLGAVKMRCETDFVANAKEFRALAKNIAMHVCVVGFESVELLLDQDFVVGENESIGEMIQSMSAKTGEKIVIETAVCL
jgi:translation elongation factor EF-Ts